MSDNRPLRLIKGPSQRSLPSPRCPVFFLRPASFSSPLLSASPIHSTPHHAIIHSGFASLFFPLSPSPCGESLVSTQLSLPPFLFRRPASPSSDKRRLHVQLSAAETDPVVQWPRCVRQRGFVCVFSFSLMRGKMAWETNIWTVGARGLWLLLLLLVIPTSRWRGTSKSWSPHCQHHHHHHHLTLTLFWTHPPHTQPSPKMGTVALRRAQTLEKSYNCTKSQASSTNRRLLRGRDSAALCHTQS